MSGTGALGDSLAKLLKSKAAIKRVRADTFGYLQRSFPGVASKIDQAEAFAAGKAAVKAAVAAAQGASLPTMGTIAIRRAKGKGYKVSFVPAPVRDAAKYTRSVPPQFIAANGHDVTKAFISYAKPLVGDLPACEVL
jgi:6-phosphofructokinase 1